MRAALSCARCQGLEHASIARAQRRVGLVSQAAQGAVERSVGAPYRHADVGAQRWVRIRYGGVGRMPGRIRHERREVAGDHFLHISAVLRNHLPWIESGGAACVQMAQNPLLALEFRDEGDIHVEVRTCRAQDLVDVGTALRILEHRGDRGRKAHRHSNDGHIYLRVNIWKCFTFPSVRAQDAFPMSGSWRPGCRMLHGRRRSVPRPLPYGLPISGSATLRCLPTARHPATPDAAGRPPAGRCGSVPRCSGRAPCP